MLCIFRPGFSKYLQALEGKTRKSSWSCGGIFWLNPSNLTPHHTHHPNPKSPDQLIIAHAQRHHPSNNSLERLKRLLATYFGVAQKTAIGSLSSLVR